MAISPPAPLAGAPLSNRLADTHSSPVRELLQIAMRPEVISLAGGLPAPQTFDVEGLRAAFDEVLAGPQAIRALQYSSTEGDPRLTRASGAVHVHARPARRSRRPADHDRLAAGARADRDGAAEPGRRRPGRGPDVPGGAAGVPARGPAAGRDPVRRGRADPRGADRDRESARGEGRLPDPDLPEPDRAHDVRRSGAAPSPRPPRRRACGWSRTTRTARCGSRASRVDLLAAQPAARDRTIVIQTLSKVLSPGLRIGYVRAPEALRGPLTVAKQAADLHTSTVAQMAAARWLASHDLATHIPASARTTARAATRCSPACRSTCPRARAGRTPRAACSSGSSCRTATTPRACSPARSSAASRSSPACTSTRASRGARPCACPSPPRRPPSCTRAPPDSGRRSPGRRPRHARTTTPRHGPGARRHARARRGRSRRAEAAADDGDA